MPFCDFVVSKRRIIFSSLAHYAEVEIAQHSKSLFNDRQPFVYNFCSKSVQEVIKWKRKRKQQIGTSPFQNPSTTLEEAIRRNWQNKNRVHMRSSETRVEAARLQAAGGGEAMSHLHPLKLRVGKGPQPSVTIRTFVVLAAAIMLTSSSV